MPADMRINDVTTDVNITDADSLLTTEVLEKIIQAVLDRLEELKRDESEQEEEAQLGARNAF